MDELNESKIEDMQRFKEKVRGSWLDDGIWEILWGIWFLVASSGAFVIYLCKESLALKIAVLVMIVVGSIVSVLFWKHFRTRYSWPKGGYAILRHNYTMLSRIAIIMILISFFVYMFMETRFKGIFLGVCIFFIFLFLYSSSGSKRFAVISSVPLLAGIISLLFKTPKEIVFNFIIFCPTGIALLVSGLKVFRGFRRKYDG